jgi:type I restriction enzyme S subunit
MTAGPEVVPNDFRQAEAGPVPKDWELKPLGTFVALQRGHDLTARDRRQGNVPVMGSAGQNGFHNTARVRGPGVVLGRSGASFGQAHYCITDFWPHNTALYVTDFFGNYPLFVFYYLKSIDFRRHNSGGAQQSLNRNFIAPIIVAVPKRVEQEAIAEALADADAVIESLEQLLAKERYVKQGAIQQLLTGKKRLPGFTCKWDTKRLGDLGHFLKGSGITKSQAVSGQLPCIRYGELYTRHNNYIRNFYSWISREVAFTATRLMRGDILFAGSGETKEEIGKCAAFVSDSEAYAGGDIVILRSQANDPVFLGYYLNTPHIARQKASRGQGDAVVHISAAALAAIEGKFPNAEEQIAIATILSDMDAQIAALDAKLTKVRAIKQGMMQELLTGRIRLV